jgi:hypothetical protein
VRSIQVVPGIPIVRSVSLNRTAGGFELAITALSNTRELKQATVHFHPAGGATLQSLDATIALSDPAKTWFAGGDSANYGGQFTLTLPFTFNGPAVTLDSVSLILTNTIGDSAESAAKY